MFIHASLLHGQFGLLLLLAVLPRLYPFEVLELGTEDGAFGKATLSMTVDPSTLWLGAVIDAVETKAQLPELSFLGGKFKRFMLERDSRFLQLVLLGPEGSSITTTLLFRFSDLYLIGFANRDNHWFVIEGCEDDMPGATVLPFGYTYSQLLEAIEGDKVAEKVANLALGRAPTLEAVTTLGTSDPSNLDPKQVSSALGLFALTVSESLRFLPIRAKIGTILESETVGYLNDKDYDYISNWVRVSLFLLCSLDGRPLGNKRGYKILVKKIKIKNDQDAINVIGIMAWPNIYNPNDMEASCDDYEKKKPPSE